MTGGVLVVGYGNVLRTDDGLGWHAAERLADDPRFDGVVLGRHQLTPELALDLSAAAFVVLVDASHGPPAGTFTIARVEPATDAGTTTWSHHLSPPGLVALAHELYGEAPDVFLVSCGVESLELGERLSPVVEAALPQVVDAVVELVASRAAGPDAVGRGLDA
jgi:hydrogenase maturation protease